MSGLIKRKECYIVRLEEVIIRREDEYAVIDDHELSLEEFGRLLTTHAGWGMRIEFVPEDEIHRRPTHAVREPHPDQD